MNARSRSALFFAAASALVACSGGESTTGSPGPTSTATGAASTAASAKPSASASQPEDKRNQPIPCTDDSACPKRLACGPCTPGDAVKPRDVMQECYVNPCVDSATECKNGVCVVGPNVRKNPAVWGSASPSASASAKPPASK